MSLPTALRALRLFSFNLAAMALGLDGAHRAQAFGVHAFSLLAWLLC